MAYGTLPRPGYVVPDGPNKGLALGPCVDENCGHIDCNVTRDAAAWPCRFCNQPIGYDTPFYKDRESDNPLAAVHMVCLEDNMAVPA